MKVLFNWNSRNWEADLNQFFDLTFPLFPGAIEPSAYYAPPFTFEPVRMGSFVGAVAEGGPVNYRNLHLNPHGNGTHTESLQHIADRPTTINRALRQYHFPARLITALPKQKPDGDQVVDIGCISTATRSAAMPPAVLLRVLSSENTATQPRNFSGTNPTYLDAALTQWLQEQGVMHLLTDLPSLDREQDNGKLSAHKAFWGFPDALRHQATITEMLAFPPGVPDGVYLLNLQIPAFETDAAPSRILLFPARET